MSQPAALSDAIIKIGRENPSIFVLSPDTGASTLAANFGKEFPDRYVCTGIAEQNTIGIAAGLSSVGWNPIVIGYAMFIGGKAWEPFRTSICYPNLNVKMIATHAGLNVGKDGVSHQAIEDLAIMRVIPNLSVLIPRDENQVSYLLKRACSINGPVYIRLERESDDPINQKIILTSSEKSELIAEGSDVTILAVGSMVKRSLEAGLFLKKKGISARVINMYSLKPIDMNIIFESAKKTGAFVTVEDHNIRGGLGGAIAEICSQNCPVPIEMVGIRDIFAESGDRESLFRKYHLDISDIIHAVEKVLIRK